MCVISDYKLWMVGKGLLSPSSADAYGSDCYIFERWLIANRQGVRWSGVRSADVEDFVSYLIAEKYEFSSVCRMLSALSSIYRYFVHCKGLKENPVCTVARPRPTYHQREALSIEVVTKALSQSNLSKSTKALISLIVESGLRIGECMALSASDVSLERQEVRVMGKGRNVRIAYFGDATARYLGDYMRSVRCSARLFPQSRRDYNWAIHHALKPFAGAHKCSPHILRHTFATESLANGLPIDLLMVALGHKSINTTLLYTHCQSSRFENLNRINNPRL